VFYLFISSPFTPIPGFCRRREHGWLTLLYDSSPSGSPGRGDRTLSIAEDPNAVLSELNASGWRGGRLSSAQFYSVN